MFGWPCRAYIVQFEGVPGVGMRLGGRVPRVDEDGMYICWSCIGWVYALNCSLYDGLVMV